MKKLQQLQSRLKAPKNQQAKFGDRYKYRSCEDIVEAVKPLADELGLILLLSDKLQQIGERYYIQATATIIDTETNERIETTAYAREAENKKGMDDAQLTGATSSYARKYALNGLLAIDDTKDMDTDEYKKQAQNKAQKQQEQEQNQQEQQTVADKLIDPIKQTALLELAAQKDTKMTDILQKYNLQNLNQMTIAQFMNEKQHLENKLDKQQIQDLKDLAQIKEIPLEDIEKGYGKKIEQLTTKEYQKTMANLRKR